MRRVLACGIIISMCLVIGLSGQARGEDEMIKQGSTVKINYELTVNGEVLDSSDGREPLEFVQGAGRIIPGLERELEGLKVGDSKIVVVAAADAYGDVVTEAVQELDRSRFPDQEQLQIGGGVQGQAENGQVFRGVIKEIKDETIVVDFNHPLAGKDLTFDVTIVEIS